MNSETATSFYIPRVWRRWMPHQIEMVINGAGISNGYGSRRARAIRVDIVPIVRPESDAKEPYAERIDPYFCSAYVYLDEPIDYSNWANGPKGGKQSRIYINPCSDEFWVLMPNNPRSVIPFTTNTLDEIEEELNALQGTEFLSSSALEQEIWNYNLNCIKFYRHIDSPDMKGIGSKEFVEHYNKIHCAWVSIHQIAANVGHLTRRFAAQAARETGESLEDARRLRTL